MEQPDALCSEDEHTLVLRRIRCNIRAGCDHKHQHHRKRDARSVCADAARHDGHEGNQEKLHLIEHVDDVQAVDRDMQECQHRNIGRPPAPQQQTRKCVQHGDRQHIGAHLPQPAAPDRQQHRKRSRRQKAKDDRCELRRPLDRVRSVDGAVVVGDQPHQKDRNGQQQHRAHDLVGGSIAALAGI